MFVRLHKTYVRPHLEYCVAAWRSSKKKNINRLERVQRRAPKLVPQLRYMNYESRLANLGIPTLEERRLRGDLIQYYKFHKGLNQASWYFGSSTRNEFTIVGPSSGIMGSQHRLYSQFTKIEARRRFFTNRIVNEWNKFDNNVVSAKTVNGFKRRLDKFSKSKK